MQDPHLVAMNLTSGNLNFGISHAERMSAALLMWILVPLFLFPAAVNPRPNLLPPLPCAQLA